MNRKVVFGEVEPGLINTVIKRALSDPNGVASISVDKEVISGINPSVITLDNAWALVVGCSLSHPGSYGDRLYRTDVESIILKDYSGQEVIDALLGVVVESNIPIGLTFESDAPYPPTYGRVGLDIIGSKRN